MGVCEVNFFDTTNRLAARTETVVAAERLVILKYFTS